MIIHRLPKFPKKLPLLQQQRLWKQLGEEAFAPAVITSGSDDFHFYTIHNPELKAVMIGIGADLGPGLHHPDMTFNREALDIGARVLATVKKLLIWRINNKEDYPRWMILLFKSSVENVVHSGTHRLD